MTKKIVKRKKLRVFRLLLIVIVPVGLFFGVYNYLKLPVVNLIVKGNEYLEDDYILYLAEVEDYPSFWLTSMHKAEKKLEKSSYIKKATIKRRFYHVLTIDISENKALFIKGNVDKVVFEDGKEIDVLEDFSFRIPRLLNSVPLKNIRVLLMV